MSKRWKPNEEQRQQIETMAGLGMPHWQIAAILGISDETLDLALKKDITLQHQMKRGVAKASVNIRRTAYEKAFVDRDPKMIQYWLNCRERWAETSKVELTGAEGSPLQVVVLPSNEREKN